jgi:hypothetical protein
MHQAHIGLLTEVSYSFNEKRSGHLSTRKRLRPRRATALR